MIYNRIPITFGALRAITAPAISYQYDAVQMLVINGLELPDYYEVDFCNPGDSQTITIVGTADGVRIPDNLLLTGKDVIAYIVIQGIDEGAVETRYEVKIPVRNRPARSDIQPTPSERLEIDELVNALNDGVTRAEDAATEAESQADRAETAADNAQSAVEHYPKIEDGYWYVWLNGEWVNTGVKAEGVDGKGIASVTGQKTSASGLVDTYTLTVTYTDSTTDTITFTVTNGTDGVSPEVSIETITGGHRVTITDKDHPTGQSFDVMDGEVSQADLDAALATKAPVIIDTASGAIASFSDGADNMPVKSLVCQINPVQSGTGDPSPDNERPITGFTGLTVNHIGENLYETATFESGYYNDNGEKASSNDFKRTADYIPVTPGDVIVWSLLSTRPSSSFLRIFGYDANKANSQRLARIQTLANIQYDGSVTIPDEIYYISFSWVNENWEARAIIGNGETIPVSWQTEAGTVYGGTLDVTTGVLTVTHAIDELANLSWAERYAGSVNKAWSSNLTKFYSQLSVSPIAENYAYKGKISAASSLEDPDSKAIGIRTFKQWSATETSTAKVRYVVSGKDDTPSGKIVYLLATPITYQLDPVTVSTLLGENNIWHDVNGDTAVDYCADTKLYLEKLTQPTEDDMIANSAIESGKYFFVGNRLFLSTAAIANGATLTPGTNCVETNLAEALNALNS